MATSDEQRQFNVNQAFANLSSATLAGTGGINANSNYIASLLANAPSNTISAPRPVLASANVAPSRGAAPTSVATRVPTTSSASTRVSLPSSIGVGVGGGTSLDLTALSKMLSAGQSKIDPIIAQLQEILSGYSKDAALSDATALMNQRSQIENQKNQPVIQRAVEGAGTSGSSMSALLAGRMAADTAQNAAALGAEQAKAYGGISANLGGTLAQLVASGDPMAKILAGILQTGMQTEASMRNTDVDVASRQYAVDNQKQGTGLSLPVESRSAPVVMAPIAQAPVGGSPFAQPWYQTSASSISGGTSGGSRY